MATGYTVILLRLEVLYDSLYDVLNQRYLVINNNRFCRICMGGESIRCKVDEKFKCIVVCSQLEAHHQVSKIYLFSYQKTIKQKKGLVCTPFF